MIYRCLYIYLFFKCNETFDNRFLIEIGYYLNCLKSFTSPANQNSNKIFIHRTFFAHSISLQLAFHIIECLKVRNKINAIATNICILYTENNIIWFHELPIHKTQWNYGNSKNSFLTNWTFSICDLHGVGIFMVEMGRRN